MFGGVGVRVVARQCLGVSSDTLLLQELRGRWREECHVVHGAHRLHLRGGDEAGGGERAMADYRLPLEGTVEVFQEERLQCQGARPC